MKKDWKEVQGRLTRTFEFPDFAGAMVFVNKVATLAEELDHHPDFHIDYKKVTLELTTHSAGKVTEKDRELAERISRLI